MAQILVIIPGTFNPVTRAHTHMADTVKKHFESMNLQATIVFVPSKSAFLTDWKHMQDTQIMPDGLRLHLMHLALQGTGYLCDSCEIDRSVSGKTIDTLDYLKQKYDAEKVFWVCGSDKLSEIKIWFRAEDIIAQYCMIVLRRSWDNAEQIIREDSLLSRYQDRICVLENGDEFQSVSATQVREAIACGELSRVKALLDIKVFHYLEELNGGMKHAGTSGTNSAGHLPLDSELHCKHQ